MRDLDPVGTQPVERVRTLLHRLRDLAEAHPDAAAALLRTSVDRASDAAHRFIDRFLVEPFLADG